MMDILVRVTVEQRIDGMWAARAVLQGPNTVVFYGTDEEEGAAAAGVAVAYLVQHLLREEADDA